MVARKVMVLLALGASHLTDRAICVSGIVLCAFLGAMVQKKSGFDYKCMDGWMDGWMDG